MLNNSRINQTNTNCLNLFIPHSSIPAWEIVFFFVFLYRAEICIKDCLEDQTKTGCESFTIDHSHLRCNFYREHCSKIQESKLPKQHQTWQRHCKKQPPSVLIPGSPGKFYLKNEHRKIEYLKWLIFFHLI